ncbi:hypothetical protein FOXYSP1_04865 [Fusarium oxysporum f. sp. phaseoli]
MSPGHLHIYSTYAIFRLHRLLLYGYPLAFSSSLPPPRGPALVLSCLSRPVPVVLVLVWLTISVLSPDGASSPATNNRHDSIRPPATLLV